MSALIDFKKRVHAIDWGRYRDLPWASGLPRVIIDLTDAQAAGAQADEYYSWANDVEHDLLPRSGVHEVTCLAIPLLIEILRERWAVAPAVPYDVLAVASVCAKPGNRDRRIVLDGGEQSLLDVCRRRLAEGADVYMRDATNPLQSEECRKSAAEIVVNVPELGAERERLAEVLRTGPPQLRAALASVLEE